MVYSLKLFVSDDTSAAQRGAAERRFRDALETSLGDASLVPAVYAAYLRLLSLHGETPDPEALSTEERTVLEYWQQAEAAALEAVFGPHRHLDEGGYEITLL